MPLRREEAKGQLKGQLRSATEESRGKKLWKSG